MIKTVVCDSFCVLLSDMTLTIAQGNDDMAL